MRKIFIFLILALVSPCFSGCADFLDETPNKSGSAYVYHMDQLEGLMGNYTLYRTGYPWTDLIFRGDGLDYAPHYVISASASGTAYDVWNWNDTSLASLNYSATTWTPSYSAIFTFNTVLENMDKVTQTTDNVRKQVEGEALFGRAYHHFLLLVQYALWDDSAPGIGYRTNTSATEIPLRETVAYTLERIYQDLTDAEKALTEAGRTTFEIKRNFRPTVPTVKALRARIDLYRGNYADALTNANAALAGYDYLLDFKNDPLYEVGVIANINVLNQGNTAVASTMPYKGMTKLSAQGSANGNLISSYPEFYLPHSSELYYGNRTLPISKYIFDLFDRANDERWLRFYDNNYILYNSYVAKTIVLPGGTSGTAKCFTWEDQQGLEEWNYHAYIRFHANSSSKSYILGMTTAEMYLIKAECLARSGQTAQAAEVLKTLRRTRFTTNAAADAIGGTVQEVLDERTREMGELWRFFDIKRLNGAENAGITITRTVLKDFKNINSTETYVIQPNDSRWAIPISNTEILLTGWKQN